MKQISQNMIIFFLLTMTLSTGCDTEPPKPQSVVINIRTIVDATGISEEIKNLTDAIN